MLGWKGRRLVYLFAVARVDGLSHKELTKRLKLTVSASLSKKYSYHARVGGLAPALFGRLGSSSPLPVPSLLSLLLLGVFVYLLGWKGVLFSQSRHQVSSVNHVLPVCTLRLPS